MTARPLAVLLLLAGGCHLLIGHRAAPGDAPPSSDGARERGAPMDARVERAAGKDAAGPDAIRLDRSGEGGQAKDLGATLDLALKDLGPAVKEGGAGKPLEPVCDATGWCWDHPVPQGNTLHGVWGTSASDLYAVGDGRTATWART